MQNELDAITRREQNENNRALWRALLEILPPRRVCETLLEYVLQEVSASFRAEETKTSIY
jgi:hypothetical protein